MTRKYRPGGGGFGENRVEPGPRPMSDPVECAICAATVERFSTTPSGMPASGGRICKPPTYTRRCEDNLRQRKLLEELYGPLEGAR